TAYHARSRPRASRKGTRAGSVEASHKTGPETRRGQGQGFPADEITQIGFASTQDYHVAGAGRAPPCARLPAHRVNQGMILLRALERQGHRLLWRKARCGEACRHYAPPVKHLQSVAIIDGFQQLLVAEISNFAAGQANPLSQIAPPH